MPRNIVICCDGTCNQFGSVNTNVVRLFQSVVRDSDQQVAFYDPGVGTFAATFFGFYIGKFLGKLLGAAFGYGVKRNMETCYRFLMDHYAEGDRVYLFGFSRGAFTARSLASMLDRCGLLHPGHQNLIPYVSAQYFGTQDAAEIDAFKRTFCRECKPRFVGVWDTVGSIGWLKAFRQFRHNRLSPGVAFACHAVSIDEKRSKFPVTLWDEAALQPGQQVEQVWFAGVHCDVGGGYADHALANIPFHWMLEHAAARGLEIRDGYAHRWPGDFNGPIHHSRTGWWRLLPARVRTIPPDANIHPSVRERMAADPSYRPGNLAPPR